MIRIGSCKDDPRVAGWQSLPVEEGCGWPVQDCSVAQGAVEVAWDGGGRAGQERTWNGWNVTGWDGCAQHVLEVPLPALGSRSDRLV